MAIDRSRILKQGDTPYAHEREGITFVEEQLPNTDPFLVWELVDLVEPNNGRQYEVDMIVLGYSAMYLVEIKSGPGRYTGDSLDWYRHIPGQGARYMDPPIKLANHKCKVLRSLLERHLKNGADVPRIEPLVFLSHQDVTLDFRPDGAVGVVTRETVRDALTHHKFPGAPANWRGERIDTPRVKRLVEACKAIGMREQKGRERAGSYILGGLLRDGETFQDRDAEHEKLKTHVRARVYLVPQQTSIERRRQLVNAAEREAALLIDVRGSQYVMGCKDYVHDGPRGPTVLFEPFDRGEPLDSFLRGNNLSFQQRLELIRQLATALDYCHKRAIIHGAVSPDSVLARLDDDGKPELRLYNFQLASNELTSGTIHASVFGLDPKQLYQAPELRLDPRSRTTASDVFGLGATAYLILTGQAPGADATEVEKRLVRDRCLDPSVDGPQLSPGVVEAIKLATGYALLERADVALDWWRILEGALEDEANAAKSAQVSPLEAAPGDILDGRLLVESLLGEGSSSRVIQVNRESDNRSYALKVSLNVDQDARLRAEAALLAELSHSRIVSLAHPQPLVLGERVCILLTLAGEQTLQRELAAEGTVSLEYAARYGEDLLSALEQLEEKSVIHRDIKPANLGIGATGRGKKHLTLFDFSLTSAPLTDLGVGTAVYRDPFLADRGRWDHQADHYSAAVTLHEMLSGVRARWGTDQIPPRDERAELQLVAASFDPALRDQLVAFFTRALAKAASQRFADAREMRKAWERAFQEPRTQSVAPELTEEQQSSTEAAPEQSPEQRWPEALIRTLNGDSPLEALPLSTRAKNALDRAGVVRATQVLALPDNRLSAIRGAGRKVQREIHDFRERFKAVHGVSSSAEVYFPGYRGEDRSLDLAPAECAPAFISALEDAGLTSLAAIAAAPKEHVQQVAARVRAKHKPLRDWLMREHEGVQASQNPQSVADWLKALLPSKAVKQREHLEGLFGLSAPFVGRLDVSASEVARHHQVVAANVHITMSKARERWAEIPAIDSLVELVSQQVTASGGAISLQRIAERLADVIPMESARADAAGSSALPSDVAGHSAAHDDTAAGLRLAQVAALARVAGEVAHARGDALQTLRLPGRGLYLVDSAIEARALTTLGAMADRLAERDVPASPAEAARQLAAAVPDSPLATREPSQLIALACDVSTRAACSTRLEIYPRGLSAERALQLTASVLTGALTPEAVGQRVAGRYPDAERLPSRPELDALLTPLKLHWSDALNAYAREGESDTSGLGTRGPTSLTHHRSGHNAPRRIAPVTELATRDFDDQLRAAVEADAFRVLGVSVPRAPLAIELLEKRHALRVRSFDALFFAALERLTASGKPSLDMVLAAAAKGEKGPRWKALADVAEKAAKEAVAQLVPAREATLVTQLGLIAHFGLDTVLESLVTGAQRAESRTVFLLVPATERTPRIENRLTIPGLLPGQTLWIPREWLGAQDSAA